VTAIDDMQANDRCMRYGEMGSYIFRLIFVKQTLY